MDDNDVKAGLFTQQAGRVAQAWMANYLTSFQAPGSTSEAARSLIASPIKNGSNPAAIALLKLPSTTASHVMPQI